MPLDNFVLTVRRLVDEFPARRKGASEAEREIDALSGALSRLRGLGRNLVTVLDWPLELDRRDEIVDVLRRGSDVAHTAERLLRHIEPRVTQRSGRGAWSVYWAVLKWEITGGRREGASLRMRLTEHIALFQMHLLYSQSSQQSEPNTKLQQLHYEFEHSGRYLRPDLPSIVRNDQIAESNTDSGSSGSNWAAGTVISVDLFARPEQLRVELVSSKQVNNGATAVIFLGRSRIGPMALKVFGGIMSPAQRLALNRELRNVRGLNHDHILPFIGSAVHELKTMLISPFMQNGDMLSYLRTNPGVRRCELILQVARGLKYLHVEKLLIHGDIKCENVLISDAGNALLTDFGLSTFTDNSHMSTTLTGLRIFHTLQFAAPELLLGEISQELSNGRQRPRSKSTKTDVYAFGMLVVQAFIETSPWPGFLPPQIVANVVAGHVHPRPGRDIESAEMSDSWWNVCRMCWTLDPSGRPGIDQVAKLLRRS